MPRKNKLMPRSININFESLFVIKEWNDLKTAVKRAPNDPLTNWYAYYFRMREARRQEDLTRRKELLREAFGYRDVVRRARANQNKSFDRVSEDISAAEALLRGASDEWVETLADSPRVW